jgi:hypothetical protein
MPLVLGGNLFLSAENFAGKIDEVKLYGTALHARQIYGNYSARPCRSQEVKFLRGDSNGDGDASGVTDAIVHLEFNFFGRGQPPCLAACDVNGDGDISGVTDAIHLLTYNLLGGPPPAAPYPSCGRTREDDKLTCESLLSTCP